MSLLDPARRRRLGVGLMAASGFAALGYQIVWTQQLASALGHEAAAVLAVVAAFFGGLAVGAFVLGTRVERSARPARWYGACEATVALWSLLLAIFMGPVNVWLLEATGIEPGAARQWAVAFCGSFALLLPATAAMGATLPAMQKMLARTPGTSGSIGALYAANTCGAVLGVLAAAFWLVPAFGLALTASLCVALNLICAALALVFMGDGEKATRVAANGGNGGSGGGSGSSLGQPRRSDVVVLPLQATAPPLASAAGVTSVVRPGGAAVLPLLAATGLFGIGYEVLVVRVLSQVSENTVYTFAMLLAVYLVGTAIGAAAYQRRSRALGADPIAWCDRLLVALAFACLLGSASLWAAAAFKAWLSQMLDVGMPAALAAEAALAVAAFGLPTIVMGALFSDLARRALDAGIGLGPALGANTLGAAAAPWLFGVVLLPALGAKVALLALGTAYLALASRRAWSRPGAWSAAVAAAALAVWTPPLVFVDVPDGGRIVSYQEGPTAAVSVVEDAQGVLRLRIDNRQQEGSSSSRFADARQALLPLLLHPAPRRALFLGLGTGVTASAAAAHAGLEVDAVELLPEVIEAARHFTQASDGAATSSRPDGRLQADPHAPGRTTPPRASPAALHTTPPATSHANLHTNLHTIAADARRFVRVGTERYDVVVADNFHPARSGSGALYTVEHFRAVRERLAAGGVFCQWLPLHQLDRRTLRSIVRTFIAVYPQGWAMLATNSLETPVLGLVARRDVGGFDVGSLRQRMVSHGSHRGSDEAATDELAALGLFDAYAVFGSFVAGPHALAALAGDAPLNTDDHPVVAYLAPRVTYAADSLPRDRLIALLRELSITPGEVADHPPDAGWTTRLAAYWQARDRFIEAGRDVQPSADVRRMLAQVREPLLSVLRTSPDFRPAYDPLLSMAVALAGVDRPAALQLLGELASVQPARSEPAALARRWADASR